MKRDGIDFDSAMRRLKVQLSDSEVRSRADFVIETDTDTESLRRCVREIVNEITDRTKG
jgi:dephospho-CoA kinase